MGERLIWLQMGILLGICELFFGTYHFLIVGLSAMLVAFVLRYLHVSPYIGFAIFCVLAGAGLVALSIYHTTRSEEKEIVS